MRQLVIKGRTYVHAYYVSKEYGYAPAYIRELYDTEAIEGIFYKGTLYLDVDSWQKYVAAHTTEAAKMNNTMPTATTPKEHRYRHHANERRSKYEADTHDLWPQPKKAAIVAADSTTSIAETSLQTAPKVHSTSKRLPVTLAGAESLPVETVGSGHTSYAATERPPISYTGELVVEEIYSGEEVSNTADMATTTDTVLFEEEVVKEKQPQSETHTESISRSRVVSSSIVWQRVLGTQTIALVMTVGIVASLLSLLFVEHYMIVSQDEIETTWRVSWQAATALLNR